ncbi:MAG: hypothetical protein U9Q07_03795 [Planctomycetota bacterium]|nr:hypothetical protein [Planctomycetota bacterium]
MMKRTIKFLKDLTPAGRLVIVTVLVLVAAIVILLALPAEADRPWMAPEEPPIIIIDEHCCTCDDCDQNGCKEVEEVDRAESEMPRERMIEEVALLWTMYFDDDNAPVRDKRRGKFDEYAEHLVDAVIMYQNTPTDIGGQLPGHKNDHLVMAYIVAKESSVTYDVVGTSNEEVGLMQCHGKSLAGYSPERVQHNPRLGLLLGVRWLTSQLPKCEQEGSGVFGETFAWEDSDWIGPLSVYAGGQNAIRKNGTCAHFKKSKERVDAVRMFRTRIDYEMDFQGE